MRCRPSIRVREIREVVIAPVVKVRFVFTAEMTTREKPMHRTITRPPSVFGVSPPVPVNCDKDK